MFLSSIADWVVDTADDFGDAFSAAGGAVIEQVSSIAAGAGDLFSDAIDTTGDVVNEIYSDGKGIVIWAGDRFEQAEDLAVSTVNSGTRIAENITDELGVLGESAISSATSVVSMPLLLLGGGLGLAMVFAGKNSSVSYAR